MRTILGQRPAFDRYDITKPVEPYDGVPTGETYATAIHIVAVASVTAGIDWSAYFLDASEIGSTIQRTLDYGDKLPEAAARALFPGVTERYRL